MARVYNGGLGGGGAEPPAGSRGKASGQGFRRASIATPEAESFLAFGRPTELAKFAALTASEKLDTKLNRISYTLLRIVGGG